MAYLQVNILMSGVNLSCEILDSAACNGLFMKEDVSPYPGKIFKAALTLVDGSLGYWVAKPCLSLPHGLALFLQRFAYQLCVTVASCCVSCNFKISLPISAVHKLLHLPSHNSFYVCQLVTCRLRQLGLHCPAFPHSTAGQ